MLKQDKNKIKKAYPYASIALSVLVFFLLLPSFSFAQGTLEIVPCGDTRPCTTCDFYVLAANVFRYMWYLATFLAILFIAWGGFLMLISGASPGNLQKGKNTVWNAIIGLVIAFSSWMVVNTFIHFLINPDIFPVSWSEPQC
jgi:hypothetical protein